MGEILPLTPLKKEDKSKEGARARENQIPKAENNGSEKKEGASGGSVRSRRLSSSVKEDDDLAYKPPNQLRLWLYDFMNWFLSIIIDCFFREIRPRGAFRIPRSGPVIFVAAPHANQFVDPFLLMKQVLKESHRRILFLIAAKSYKHRVLGLMSRCQLSIPVARAQDNLVPGTGKIYLDFDEDRLLVRGMGTKFTQECLTRGLIALAQSLGVAEIEEIVSDTELRLRKEFKDTPKVRQILKAGSRFKRADKIDQKRVFRLVFKHLSAGKCIGIFPEGGSHDRPGLLPLKAGVAIMALGSMNYDPNCKVKIVPCGMNYFHADKFRSRAVIEFGNPIEVSSELVAKYACPESSKQAINELLDTIITGLRAVTFGSKDYETMMVVQAARRLYAGNLAHSLPLPLVVEMNRRLVQGYERFEKEPQIQELRKKILIYNKMLKQLYLPDHQVESCDESHKIRVAPVLIYRVFKLLILMLLALPGSTLFSPVFLCAMIISKRKAKAALAHSNVKIKANDVLATWKILIGMGIAPLVYLFYAILGTWYCYHNDIFLGKRIVLTFILLYTLGVLVTGSALLTGEQGMDIFKSLRPLYLSITSGSSIRELKAFRKKLEAEITEVVNTFGPQMYPDNFNLLKIKDKLNISDDVEFVNSDEEEERKTQSMRYRRLQRRKAEKLARLKMSETEFSPDSASTAKAADIIGNEVGTRNSSFNSLNSFSNSDGFSTLASESSYINVPMFSDYAINKNINLSESHHPSPSASSLSVKEDYNVTSSLLPPREDQGGQIELNFKPALNTKLSGRIRHKLIENRKKQD